METVYHECLEGGCGWACHSPRMECVDGGKGCGLAHFLSCEESDFHDANLVKATTAIKAILSLVPPDPSGRNLSLVQTNLGVILAWVEHSDMPSEGGVTKDSDDATVIEALKIKVDSTNQQAS